MRGLHRLLDDRPELDVQVEGEQDEVAACQHCRDRPEAPGGPCKARGARRHVSDSAASTFRDRYGELHEATLVAPMARLTISLLGPPRAEIDGAAIEVDTRKASRSLPTSQ